MFELDREVTAWSEAANANRCRNAAGVAELKDHLYCEIDRARAEGMSDEQAFAAAAARLGTPSQLAAERAKDRSLLGSVCALASRLDRGGAGPGTRRLMIAHGVVWASVVVASSLLVTSSSGRATAEWLILLVLIPSWLGSEQILRRALRSRYTGGSR